MRVAKIENRTDEDLVTIREEDFDNDELTNAETKRKEAARFIL
jgi:hypothetical protein